MLEHRPKRSTSLEYLVWVH